MIRCAKHGGTLSRRFLDIREKPEGLFKQFPPRSAWVELCDQGWRCYIPMHVCLIYLHMHTRQYNRFLTVLMPASPRRLLGTGPRGTRSVDSRPVQRSEVSCSRLLGTIPLGTLRPPAASIAGRCSVQSIVFLRDLVAFHSISWWLPKNHCHSTITPSGGWLVKYQFTRRQPEAFCTFRF